MIPPRGALTTTKRREPMILSSLLLILLSFSLAWMVHRISLSPLLILYFKEKFLAISLYLSLPPPPQSSPPTPLPEKLWHPSSSLCQASSSSLFIAPPSSSSSLSLLLTLFSLFVHISPSFSTTVPLFLSWVRFSISMAYFSLSLWKPSSFSSLLVPSLKFILLSLFP